MSFRYVCDRCGESAQDSTGRLAGSISVRLAGHVEEGGGDLCWHCRATLLAWWREGGGRIGGPLRRLGDVDRPVDEHPSGGATS